MSATITRRSLVQAAGAALGTGVAGIPASALAGPAPDADAGLVDLIARHFEADGALCSAEDEADWLFGIAVSAYPPRPIALEWQEGDFPRTSFGLALSTPVEVVNGDERRAYLERGVSWLRERPAATWFRTLVPPLGPEHETRRLEILTAFDAWQTECRAIDGRTGYAAANEALGAADTNAGDLMRAILATPPMTLAGLAAKARWATGSGLPDIAVVTRLRRVAADVVALAERGEVAS